MSHKGSLVLVSLLIASACSNKQDNTEPKESSPPPKLIRIAVIDTGIDLDLLKNSRSYCKDGHKDFTGFGLNDNHGHGTHISGIIDQYAKNFIFTPNVVESDINKVVVDYCQIIIKYFDPSLVGSNNLENTIKSFRWAIDQNVDIINYSGGGVDPSEEEKKLVIEALNKGIKVVVAAGNEASNLSADPCLHIEADKDKKLCRKEHPAKYGEYYPAMYDSRIYVVGNLVTSYSNEVSEKSNYGDPVTYWEVGAKVLSRLPGNKYGTMSGTSQATAIKSGKLIREMLTH